MGKTKIEKYYIPTIDEFHVGFEYERMNGYDWECAEITPYEFSGMYCNRDEENEFDEICFHLRDVRVRYLDVNDIESFGFTHTTSLKGYQENFRIEKLFRRLNEEHDDTMWQNVFLQYAPDIHRIIIRNEISDGSEDETFFEGVIKNKSELKKLLIQLNIIEK